MDARMVERRGGPPGVQQPLGMIRPMLEQFTCTCSCDRSPDGLLEPYRARDPAPAGTNPKFHEQPQEKGLAPIGARLPVQRRATFLQHLSEIASLLQLRSGEHADRAKRGLRRVQTQTKVVVGVRRVEIRRLVPLRIPARPDLRAAL